MEDGDGYLLLSFIFFAIGFLGIIHNLHRIGPDDENRE